MNQYKDPPPPYNVQYSEVHHYGPPPPNAYPSPMGPYPPPSECHPAGPPPANYYGPPPPQAPFPPEGYGATSTTVTVENPEVVIVIGACPACRIGFLEDQFTCLGVFCAIFFFPLGILCCLALREKRCWNCGATFG